MLLQLQLELQQRGLLGVHAYCCWTFMISIPAWFGGERDTHYSQQSAAAGQLPAASATPVWNSAVKEQHTSRQSRMPEIPRQPTRNWILPRTCVCVCMCVRTVAGTQIGLFADLVLIARPHPFRQIFSNNKFDLGQCHSSAPFFFFGFCREKLLLVACHSNLWRP